MKKPFTMVKGFLLSDVIRSVWRAGSVALLVHVHHGAA